jgi:hypothetical protein
MIHGDASKRDRERYRAWLKKRYLRVADVGIERLLHRVVETSRFIPMIRYGRKSDTQEYLQ